jgi:hypothetical protein
MLPCVRDLAFDPESKPSHGLEGEDASPDDLTDPETDDTFPSLKEVLTWVEKSQFRQPSTSQSSVESLRSDPSLTVETPVSSQAPSQPLPSASDTSPDTPSAPSSTHRGGKRANRRKRKPQERRPSLHTSLQAAMHDENSRYKTQICRAWAEGGCPAGEHCPAAHGATELRTEADNRSVMASLARLARRAGSNPEAARPAPHTPMVVVSSAPLLLPLSPHHILPHATMHPPVFSAPWIPGSFVAPRPAPPPAPGVLLPAPYPMGATPHRPFLPFPNS